MYCFLTLIFNLFVLITVPHYEAVRSTPMSKPDHTRRWYQQMNEEWAEQQQHLIPTTRADGTPTATPDQLEWEGHTITSHDVMPFCKLGNRLYMIGLPGLRSFHIQVDTTQYEVRANVPLDIGHKSILVFDEKVARIAFPIHGRMVYGHRIGELFIDQEDNVWEESWHNAKFIHEEKETRAHSNSQNKAGQRIDHYYLRCSLGEVDAKMVTMANSLRVVQVPADGKKGRKGQTVQKYIENEDPREQWIFTFRIPPYETKPDAPEQKHFYYLEIKYRGAKIQLVANGEVTAESDDDSHPLYVPTDPLHNLDLQLFITPTSAGDINMNSIRLVECVHELVQ